jgi:hypothetical protein
MNAKHSQIVLKLRRISMITESRLQKEVMAERTALAASGMTRIEDNVMMI